MSQTFKSFRQRINECPVWQGVNGFYVHRLHADEVAREADAAIASRDAEIAQMYAAAGEAQAERDAARDERDALAVEVARLREDAERYQFIRWYQDQDDPPEELKDLLLSAYRKARERGSLRPSAEEYEIALDAGIAARKKG